MKINKSLIKYFCLQLLVSFFTDSSTNPWSAGIFTVFGLRLLKGRVLHKGAWVATLLRG